MNPSMALELVLLLGVVLLVVAIGLRARLEDPLLLLHRPALAVRAMVAMFVVLPAFVLGLTWFVPLQEGVGAVLLAFAVSPVLPPWAKKGIAVSGQADYAIGLQVLSSAVAVLMVPLMIWIAYRAFGVHTTLDPLAMELVLLVTVAAPLALGMGLARFVPGAAPRLGSLANRVGGVITVLGVVVLLVAHGGTMLDVIGRGTLVVIVAVIAFGLLVGHLLGGPDPGTRGALASATVSRHPAVALVLASGAVPQHEPAVVGAVLLYLLASELLAIPYERWRKQVVGAQPDVANP